ncbi:MAG: hypothetical protein KF729_20705 [Sandaracinaceae bacterium]|nr:hypothetical protein [Sandaracinaceae bacterium]
MKNATLSALLLLLLGVTWAGVAAAQADDETDGGDASEPGDAEERAVPPDAEPAEVEPPAQDPAEQAEQGTTALGSPQLAEGGDDEGEPEAPAAAEAAPAPADEPLPWRNSFFNYTNQVSTNSFWRGSQLSYNPTWEMLFSAVPRWYPGTGGFLRAIVGMRLEVTDDDSNALNREPLLNDILIDYVHPFSLGDGYILMPSLRVSIPTSRLSLAAQRYLQLGAQLTAIKIIPEAGNLTLALLGRYAYWFAGSNVVQTDDPQPDRCPAGPQIDTGAGAGIADPGLFTCGQFGTGSSFAHTLLAGLSATATPIGAFSINLSAFLFITHGYGLAPAYVDVATSEEPLMIADGSPSHWQNFTFISVSVAYQFEPWLNMSLGIQNSGLVAPVWDPSGNLYNPLFTPNTQVWLTATFTVDELWKALFTGGEDGLTPEERQRRQQGLASGPSLGGAF